MKKARRQVPNTDPVRMGRTAVYFGISMLVHVQPSIVISRSIILNYFKRSRCRIASRENFSCLTIGPSILNLKLPNTITGWLSYVGLRPLRPTFRRVVCLNFIQAQNFFSPSPMEFLFIHRTSLSSLFPVFSGRWRLFKA